MPQTLLRLPEVIRRTGLSRSMIYLLQAESKFPRSIAISERAVGWLEADVDGFIEARVTESRRTHRTAASAEARALGAA
jgi:prophage regulatory protein